MTTLKDIIQSDRDQMIFDPIEFGEQILIDNVAVPGIVIREQTQSPTVPTDFTGADDGGYAGVAGRTIEIKIKAGVVNIRAEQRRRINGLEYWISSVKQSRLTGTLTVKGFWGE